jgi:hypothetical protein
LSKGQRIEIDYAQVASQMDVVGQRGRDVEKAVKDAIRTLEKKFPGQRVVLINKPGAIVTVEGGRRYLVMRDGTLSQIAGETLQMTITKYR